jgi:hypothetical protein
MPDRYTLIACAFIAACSTGPVRWSASSWNGLAPRQIETENYVYAAAPIRDSGFKLKLSLSTDIFQSQATGAPPPAGEMKRAAFLATPAGCTMTDVQVQDDGSAIASYDCGAMPDG